MKELVKKLCEVQLELKAPKNQYNSFGEYKYRSCEDILEAVKPLTCLRGLALTVSDEVVQIGERYYVKATATITDGESSISNTAFAREMLEKKKMDDSQITGATSSYARKYALNGLLCIDDTKDADATNTHGKDVFEKEVIAEKAKHTKEVNKAVKEYQTSERGLDERFESAMAMLNKMPKVEPTQEALIIRINKLLSDLSNAGWNDRHDTLKTLMDSKMEKPIEDKIVL